jgi:hypothetical protein
MRHILAGVAMFVFVCGVALGQSGGGKIVRQSSGWPAWRLILEAKDDPLMYQSPNRMCLAPDVPVSCKPAQVYFFATLDVPIGNKLRHANFNLTDCEKVGAVAAGHFSPDVGIPAF